MERSISPRAAVRCNFSSIYVLLLFIHDPLSFPISLKISLPSSLSLSSLSSSFFNVLHDAFPRRMREKSERERWKRAGRGEEKENPGRLHRVVGLCLIKPGNETSMIRFPGARSVGRWVGFFRARFAAQTAFQPRIESNRIEKNHAGIKYERTRPYIKYAGTRGTRNFPDSPPPTLPPTANLLYRHRLV